MTSQYINETGSPYLKFRFFNNSNNTEKKHRPSKTDISKTVAEKEIIKEKMHGNIYNKVVHIHIL